MKRKLTAVAVSVVAVALIVGVIVFAFQGGESTAGDRDDSAGQQDASDSSKKESVSKAEDREETDVKSGQVSLDIKQFTYSPAVITVKKGTVVTWTNRDDVRHDVAADENKPGAPANSKLLATNESYGALFDTVGTFNYHCSPHPYMKGTIKVVE